MFLSGMQAPRICFLNPIETLFLFEHLTLQEFSESGWQLFSQILVGGWPTPLKNMKVKWDDSSQLNGTIKAMFQTTKQYKLDKQTPFSCFNTSSQDFPFKQWPYLGALCFYCACQVSKLKGSPNRCSTPGFHGKTWEKLLNTSDNLDNLSWRIAILSASKELDKLVGTGAWTTKINKDLSMNSWLFISDSG